MHLTSALLGIAVIALAGCPTDPGEGGSALVGTWEEVAAPGDDGEEPSLATFNADGTYEIDGDEIETGTFTADARTLTMTTSEGDVNVLPYALDGDRLLPMALRRPQAGDGFVGDWGAEGFENDEPQSMDLELDADLTARMTFGSDVLDGTWREQADTLITTMEIPIEGGVVPLDFTWHSVGDGIGIVLFERR